MPIDKIAIYESGLFIIWYNSTTIDNTPKKWRWAENWIVRVPLSKLMAIISTATVVSPPPFYLCFTLAAPGRSLRRKHARAPQTCIAMATHMRAPELRFDKEYVHLLKTNGSIPPPTTPPAPLYSGATYSATSRETRLGFLCLLLCGIVMGTSCFVHIHLTGGW